MNISGSIRRLTNIFLILFVALSAGLVYWQVIVAHQVAANPYLTYTRNCTSDKAPIRGNIYDSKGVLLAYSKPSNLPNLCGYQRVYTDAAKGLEGLIGYYISPLFGSTGIEKEYNDYLNGTNGVTGLDNTVDQVLHVPPRGDDIYLTVDSRIEKILVKNFPTEAPIDNFYTYKTDRGSIIVSDPTTGAILGILSEPGYDANCVVHCTLDQLRKDFMAKGYDKLIHCTSPCTNGQFQEALKGIGQDSECEENSDCNLIYLKYLNSDPKQPLIFRPTQDCYPPGSTFKTVTLMAALDSGSLGLYDEIFYNDPKEHPYPEHLQAEGPIKIGSGDDSQVFQPSISNILGYTYHFPVSLAYGFSHSDNIIFAEAGIKVGADTWLKYNRDLYVGQKIPFDLPVKVSTVTPQPQSGLCANTPPKETALNMRNLASNAFGQGVDFVTPLQMSLVDNVAANDGKLMRPAVIQKIIDPKNGSVLQSFSPQLLRQVISATAAQQVRDAMYGVTACGSGSLSVVQLSYPYTPWAVIGKTGTAQVPQTDPNKVIPGDSWFITAAPYTYQSNSIPPITITAMKENGGEGAYANGPMLRDIYASIFKDVLTNVKAPPAPDQNFCVANKFLQNP
ncbi:MAG TPA: penicillin-binding transpeptidase domain-containing protein [Ktedonobacteraceae bacterium]|nr:penicillin-binding transpeptidase domain-containing protein [Ktedonobacteraceae bacterium]